MEAKTTEAENESRQHAIERCAERNVFIPTYAMMANPELIPDEVKKLLPGVGLWDINPLNLFRITWKNNPPIAGESISPFGNVNFIEIPSKLSGVKARILMLVGKYFPTGAHKVGASFGPLVEKLVSGHFDPTVQKALWPSTGNYCRGGAFNSALLGCKAIAVLPENMSRERFEWLKEIGAEVVATPGCESNVKEVFDKNTELVEEGKGNVVSMNQFAEFGNPLWHYFVTGQAMQELFEQEKLPGQHLSGIHLTQGSAGTLSSAQWLKEKYPNVKLGCGEADECPTILENGFGDHRIEGIGDKHVPWILNAKNIDLAVAISDENCMQIMCLFNTPAGHQVLQEELGLDEEFVKEKLPLLGISGIANMLGCIKMAKYFEHDENDMLISVCTDSMEMYQSRVLEEANAPDSQWNKNSALVALRHHLHGIKTDRMKELSYYDRKKVHNLKYFTWVEQQGKTLEELNEQWYNRNYWTDLISAEKVTEWDAKIAEFNRLSGMDKKYQS